MEQENLKERIEDEIEKTRALIEEYRELSQPIAPDCAIGRVSRMDAINNKSVTESALRQAEEKLSNLERVLGFHGTADFGRCIRCKAEIPIGRILFRPQSLNCVKCAQ